MRSTKEDEPCTKKQAIDLVSAVQEFHVLSTQELSKIIREAANGIIRWRKSDGSSLEIKVESLARNLSLHLISKLLSFRRDEQHLKHLLAGLRLLHGLCDIASRHSKLEQVIFEDVNAIERILDLIFFTVIFLSNFGQKLDDPGNKVLLSSALLASSLYLLTSCISSQWHDLSVVLLSHPKVDVFTSAAFPAVRVIINFLQVKLSAQHSDTHKVSDVEVHRLSLHCEASLQFLQSLCQQHMFRERLVKNKELCKEGGVLLLVQDIMKLPQCKDSHLMGVVSRLKSRVISIMLHLCEVESISFLDLAASTTGGLDLAKSAVSEVLEVLKIMFSGDLNGVSGYHPRGILQLNAMRLTEILSDDSNFRSYILSNFTEVLSSLFLLPHGEFLTSWCSSDREPAEEDVTLDYDSLLAAGQVLGVKSASHVSFSTIRAPQSQTPYSHQRTSLLVKIVANLTCFVPDLCKEEKGLFLNKFLRCLQNSPERLATASRNFRSLLAHAGSLTPEYLNEDDVNLLGLFIIQLENHNRGQTSSSVPPDGCNQKETNVPEDEMVTNQQSEEKQLKKRKRNIMNDIQKTLMENALKDEPDMQRKAASIQLWADKLSLHGSEITFYQLKNWLNNRKAKLARAAAKDMRVGSSGTDESPESAAADELCELSLYGPDQGTHQKEDVSVTITGSFRRQHGQNVVLIDGKGEEIGKGCIHLAKGIWFGRNLEELGLCVVDVTDLKVDKWSNLPHPCNATGTTFGQAEMILGRKRVLWDSDKLLLIQQQSSR